MRWVAMEYSWNDGSKTQYYYVILDRLQGRSGGLERAPESRIRGPFTRADHRNRTSDNENVVLLQLEFLAVYALEGVELTGVEQKILSDICKGNQNRDQEKPITKAAQELQHSANGTVHFSEWSNIDGLLWFRGKVYVPQNPDLHKQIIALCHDTHIAGYPGHWKTLELVSRNYWWPQMSRYIGQYVSTCNLCL